MGTKIFSLIIIGITFFALNVMAVDFRGFCSRVVGAFVGSKDALSLEGLRERSARRNVAIPVENLEQLQLMASRNTSASAERSARGLGLLNDADSHVFSYLQTALVGLYKTAPEASKGMQRLFRLSGTPIKEKMVTISAVNASVSEEISDYPLRLMERIALNLGANFSKTSCPACRQIKSQSSRCQMVERDTDCNRKIEINSGHGINRLRASPTWPACYTFEKCPGLHGHRNWKR